MIGTGEILVIFLAILLLFGGKKLPELARSLGQAMREFRAASWDQSLPPGNEPQRNDLTRNDPPQEERSKHDHDRPQ